jgi:hypothetical protein
MRSTFLSPDNRAVRRASIALLAAATLAACDSDRAVSPSPSATRVPTSGSSSLVPGGRGDLFTGSVNGDMSYINVLGSSFNIITPLGDTMKVVDNGKFDSDATVGRVLVKQVLAGKYTLCPATAPTGYDFPYTICVSTTVLSGSGANVAFLAYVTPSLWFEVRSTALYPITGGTYTVANKLSRFGKITVSDNGANDLDPTVGRVAVKLGSIGSYSVCEVTPPAGFWPATTPCLNATNSGGTKWAGQFTNQEKQVIYNP